MWTRLRIRLKYRLTILRIRLIINNAIREKRIQVCHNPRGGYFDCKIWKHGRTVYLTVFDTIDKRLYKKLMKLFPTRWL